MPNLLLYGPPGTGKTSSIKALAFELYGKCIIDRLIELNASDERGINIVRSKIIEFAKKDIDNNKDIPPFKIILLDEYTVMMIYRVI